MLWIPRPRENGERMQKLFAEHGIESVCLPLIDIEYLKPPHPTSLKRCQQLFFFSRYAVRAMKSIGSDALSTQRVFAIGSGTATELIAANIHVDDVVPAPHTSEAFIENIDNFSLRGETGLIVGESGRKLILAELNRRSLPVIEIVVYRRIMPPLDEKTVLEFISQYRVDAVLLTSLSMLMHLLCLGTQVQMALRQMIFFVNSERIAQACRQAGFSQLVISHCASNEAMLDSILLYLRSNNE